MSTQNQATEVKRSWAYRLTEAAKDDVFNMFHNKSDGFLDAVGDGRIKIIGPPAGSDFRHFQEFQSEQTMELCPDAIMPAIGYQSSMDALTQGQVSVSDFYLGCRHAKYDDLFAVGFARPIIGNIPSISEMQAAYVTGVIAGRWAEESDIAKRHGADRNRLTRQFRNLNLQAVYPVEMFPYCDALAARMGMSTKGHGRSWWAVMTSPATTMHYFPPADSIGDNDRGRKRTYMPLALIGLLLLLKPFSFALQLFRRAD